MRFYSCCPWWWFRVRWCRLGFYGCALRPGPDVLWIIGRAGWFCIFITSGTRFVGISCRFQRRVHRRLLGWLRWRLLVWFNSYEWWFNTYWWWFDSFWCRFGTCWWWDWSCWFVISSVWCLFGTCWWWLLNSWCRFRICWWSIVGFWFSFRIWWLKFDCFGCSWGRIRTWWWWSGNFWFESRSWWCWWGIAGSLTRSLWFVGSTVGWGCWVWWFRFRSEFWFQFACCTTVQGLAPDHVFWSCLLRFQFRLVAAGAAWCTLLLFQGSLRFRCSFRSDARFLQVVWLTENISVHTQQPGCYRLPHRLRWVLGVLLWLVLLFVCWVFRCVLLVFWFGWWVWFLCWCRFFRFLSFPFLWFRFVLCTWWCFLWVLWVLSSYLVLVWVRVVLVFWRWLLRDRWCVFGLLLVGLRVLFLWWCRFGFVIWVLRFLIRSGRWWLSGWWWWCLVCWFIVWGVGFILGRCWWSLGRSFRRIFSSNSESFRRARPFKTHTARF